MANTDAFNRGFEMGFQKAKKPTSSKSSGQSSTDPVKLGKDIKSYKKGGKVKKTGLAVVHKGEYVLTKRKASKMGKKRSAKKQVAKTGS